MTRGFYDRRDRDGVGPRSSEAPPAGVSGRAAPLELKPPQCGCLRSFVSQSVWQHLRHLESLLKTAKKYALFITQTPEEIMHPFRKFKRTIASFCISLTIFGFSHKPVQAEPITTFGILKAITPFILSVMSFWLLTQSALRAEHDSSATRVLKHLEVENEFPLDEYCLSPDILMGEKTRGYLVSVEDTPEMRTDIKSLFCEKGGFSYRGKYVVGIISSKYHAKDLATVIRYRLDNQAPVYVSAQAVDVSDVIPE